MKWSWKVAEWAGIGVHVHATFLLVIGWVGLVSWLQERTVAGVLTGVAFTLVLFLCVVLHEYGHALMARRYGIGTRDITLLPIGGVARLERMPDDPRQEFWVALAGPAVNVAIALALFAWLQVTGTLVPLERLGLASGPFVERLLAVNVVLVLFNLIPAFPMDGGRVVRAVLATRMDYVRATGMAASLGQAFAVVFAIAGLVVNPFLVLIGLFVWFGASQEAAMVRTRAALRGIPVAEAMITQFIVLSPLDRLARAAALVMAGHPHDFPVLQAGTMVGVFARDDLLPALQRLGPDGSVGEAMRTDFAVAESHEGLDLALVRLLASGNRTMPVLLAGRPVGLVTGDTVSEFIRLRTAMTRASRAVPAPAPRTA